MMKNLKEGMGVELSNGKRGVVLNNEIFAIGFTQKLADVQDGDIVKIYEIKDKTQMLSLVGKLPKSWELVWDIEWEDDEEDDETSDFGMMPMMGMGFGVWVEDDEDMERALKFINRLFGKN